MNSEEIYNEFTTKILPKIAEGLTITKEYFTDLFARYIKYLIVMDSIWLGIWAILLLVSLYFVPKAWRLLKDNDGEPFVLFYVIFIIVPFVGVMDKTSDLVKDLYVPEIRVIELIRGYNTD